MSEIQLIQEFEFSSASCGRFQSAKPDQGSGDLRESQMRGEQIPRIFASISKGLEGKGVVAFREALP